MKRILLETPTAEPLSLAEAKSYLRLDGDDEDDLVGALIAAARVAVEVEARRALIAQGWRTIVATWPREGIRLPLLPVIAVDAVRAVDHAGEATALKDDEYSLDPDGSVVRLHRSPGGVDHYEIDFTAGYGETAADVPEPLRQAMRMLIAHWYENRGAVIMGATSTATPHGYRDLVAPYRRVSLC